MEDYSYPYGKKQNPEQLAVFKEKLINDYVDKILMKERILIWNSLKPNVVHQRIKTKHLSDYQGIQNRDNLFFYLEAPQNPELESLSQTNLHEICQFINEMNPWDEIDAYIFDETLNWFIAITHEDISLICGSSAE